ncbi:MAG: DUF169 domain-containing protein [Methanomicrobium sp.]|nr:DUF169 domain-containing protein [Methanomicrobium sp.]
MDISLRDRFSALWEKYFPGAELPLAIEFRDDTEGSELVPPPGSWRCIICQTALARNKTPLVFTKDSITCGGGLRYSGYSEDIHLNFRYFLSSGKKGIIKGERYKQTPEIVDEWEKLIPKYPPHKKYIHFKRWDTLTENDNPEVVVFFARPEVMSGLFTLANYDQSSPFGVICPMGSGCSSILLYPWLEQQKDDPKVVLGMFDPSARKCVPVDVLTIAFPMKRFEKVIGYMDESFLITKTWDTVQKKIKRSDALHK